jgi:hypothetical protein
MDYRGGYGGGGHDIPVERLTPPARPHIMAASKQAMRLAWPHIGHPFLRTDSFYPYVYCVLPVEAFC